MEPIRGRKLAGVSGVVYAILSGIVAALAPPPPSLASSAHEVVDYYARYQLRFLIGNYAGVLGIVPFFVLLAYLTRLVRRAEGEKGIAGLTLLGTGIAGHAVGVACLAAFQVTALTTGAGTELHEKALSDLANVLFGFYFVMQAAFTGAAGWAVLSTSVLPRALGHSAAAIAVASVVASAGTIVTTGALAAGGTVTVVVFSAYLLWSLVLSVVLIARQEIVAA